MKSKKLKRYIIKTIILFSIELSCIAYLYYQQTKRTSFDDMLPWIILLALLVSISYILFIASLIIFRKSLFNILLMLIINSPLIVYAIYVITTGHL